MRVPHDRCILPIGEDLFGVARVDIANSDQAPKRLRDFEVDEMRCMEGRPLA